MCPFLVDSGLVVPCITYGLHKRLLSAAERHGLSLERRLEMTGVCASQMALTLLGGPNRSVAIFSRNAESFCILLGMHCEFSGASVFHFPNLYLRAWISLSCVCRFTPKNLHQRPTVALLCGPHVQGAQGISCGRHLANHEVEVILFLPNFVKMLDSVTSELTLFSKTCGKQVSGVKGENVLLAN